MAEREVGWGRERSQHVDLYRKLLLRRRLLRWTPRGPAYVPFCGEGDIAAEVYTDRMVLGADIDEDFVAEAWNQVAGPMHFVDLRVADCDDYPFRDYRQRIAVADFDAWADPWPAFRSFWELAPKRKRLVMFFTDGHKINLMGDGRFIPPDGSPSYIIRSMDERKRRFNAYLSECIWPWFDGHIRPYRVVERMRYLRGNMCYWGVCVER